MIYARCLVAVLCLAVAGNGVAGALGFYEFEPNDTCATGTVFTVDSGVGGGQLSSAGDVDFFRIDVPQISVLTVTIQPSEPVYDGSSLEVWIATVSGTDLSRRKLGRDSPPTGLRAIVQPGVHCVRFQARAGYIVMTDEYRLQAALDSSDVAISSFEFEPNNSLAEADPIASDGSPVAAQLMIETDVDVFEIVTSPGTDVEAFVDVESRAYNGTSMHAWLTDRSGNILSWRKISSDQSAARMLMARRPAGGSVFLVLERRDGFTVLDRYYTVNAHVGPSAGLLESEPNDLPESDYITGPGTLRGQLASREDVDHFALTLLQGVAQFVVELEDSMYDGGTFLIDFYNAEDFLLASRQVGSDSGITTVNIGIATEGLHRIVLRPEPGIILTQKHYAITVPKGTFVFGDGFD